MILSHTHTHMQALDRWSFGVIMQICALMQDLESKRNRLPCELEAVWFIWINLCCLFVLRNCLKCLLCFYGLKPATQLRCPHVQNPNFWFLSFSHWNMRVSSSDIQYLWSSEADTVKYLLSFKSFKFKNMRFCWCMTWCFPWKQKFISPTFLSFFPPSLWYSYSQREKIKLLGWAGCGGVVYEYHLYL